MTQEEADRALAELAAPTECLVDVRLPEDRRPQVQRTRNRLQLPTYTLGRAVATRQASGDALKALGDVYPNLVVFDAEVANSTRTDLFRDAHPERFFEMFIAEQLMISVAQGMATTGRIAFASTFAAFFTRAHDQIRMVAVSQANLRLIGSHAGVSIGEDGPSQMGLEDLAMMRAICDSTVLYPADAVSTVQLVAAMAELQGISYLRTTRGQTPVLYASGETFPIGGSKILRSSDHDRATLIGAGITLHTVLKAADELAEGGIPVRVLDCYSIKPIDATTLRRAAAETRWLIVVEDHRPEGGLGEAVQTALIGETSQLVFTHLAVRSMPVSGSPQEQLERHGLSSANVVSVVRDGLQEQE
jgi:transketolase